MNKNLLACLLIISGFCSSAFAGHLSSSLLFTARMTGAAEVPAVTTTNGQGLGIFSFDEAKSTMYVNVSLSNLSGPVTGIHIHEGEPGVNGGVVINLTPFLQGNRLKATIPNITRETFAKFINGGYYLNAHTALHPGGEIRGQIELETDHRFSATLSGTNEVPAVSTTGKGLFIANLSKSETEVIFNMVFEGLSSAVTGAHIHQAPAGANGGVIFDLSPFILGNVISGTWDPSGFINALKAGELYINVHTVNHPGGEIRGQLVLEDGLLFDVLLNGDQESPSVDTRATGLGKITVSPDLSTIHYHIIVDSLSGAINGAHFHAGIAGRNGGVVLDISDDINGNVISGSAPLTIELLNMMLAGGLYINVHTDENPGGEIRGQVYKLAREPYTFDMNGGQEVPSNNSTGTGAGIVTIDRDQSNAHFIIVYSGLQGNFTGAHFHNGSPGDVGGVVFDLTPYFNGFGAAEGYWENTFETSNSLMFRNHEIYANVHSDLFPGGEIRGNVIRSSELFAYPPFDPGFGNNLIFYAELNGDSENPPVATDATGLATIYFGADRTTAKLNMTVSGLSGPITGAHIHEGFPGENGPVVFPLTVFGNRIQMDLTGITSLHMEKFITGEYYINVHTAANPAGEIRGQITLDQDLTFVAALSGDQENPPVTTNGRGISAFHYTIGQLTLDVNVQFTELSSNVTGAHLHQGAPGENGSVIVDLSQLIDGNTIRGSVDLTAFDLFSLFTGNVYVNVHTTDHPGGEIRGQLTFANGLVFDGWMSGAQEVPFATTAGSGYSIAVVSPDLEFIDVVAVTDQVSGTISGAHLHMAPVGSNGGVVLDLSTGLSDNDIAFFGPVTDEVVSGLLSGDIYINVHTPAFPGGELRGQLFRLAREGFGFDLCPEQEAGNVNAPAATGNGYVSIDRLHSNINVAVTTHGLTGPVTGAHFHEAPIGVSGGVVLDLTPFFLNGAVAGFGVPMDSTIINSILAENIYVNVHTANHPGGELRGQIVKEFLCSIETGINELADVLNEVILSPVPVAEVLNVSFTATSNNTISMNVFDLSGKLISTEAINISEGYNNVQIETAYLNAGFYMLMMSDGNASQAYKFVK